jgi:hypothetical protein
VTLNFKKRKYACLHNDSVQFRHTHKITCASIDWCSGVGVCSHLADAHRPIVVSLLSDVFACAHYSWCYACTCVPRRLLRDNTVVTILPRTSCLSAYHLFKDLLIWLGFRSSIHGHPSEPMVYRVTYIICVCVFSQIKDPRLIHLLTLFDVYTFHCLLMYFTIIPHSIESTLSSACL